MKPSKIRDMKVEEIEAELADAREKLMKYRFQQVTGQLTDSSQLRLQRKDIARMLTILGEIRAQEAADAEGEA